MSGKRKDGLSMATAAPIWDPMWRSASMKMGGEPPTWTQIFPYPTYDCTINGERTTLVTDDLSQRSQVEVFDEKGNAAPIDYEHSTTKEGVFYAPAAGRILRLVAGGKLGLLAQCEWNGQGASDLRDGSYYYDSPTFWWSGQDMRIYVFESLALTNLPGSFERGFITDQSKIDYEALLQRNAAKGRALISLNQPLQLKCAKGGTMATATTDTGATPKKTLADNVLNSMRYAFDLTLTTTGNELRKLLQTMIDLIPASEDPIFMVEDGEKATTVGQLLGLQSAVQKDTAAADAVGEALKPVRIAIGADENADGNALALAVLMMKATTAPVARVRELEAQLTAATQKTSGDGLVLKIAAARASGIGITPAQEKEALRLAEQSVGLAEAFIAAIPPVDVTTQSQGSAPAKAKELPATTGTGGNTLVEASQKANVRTRELMKEHKVDYVTASNMRLEEERTASE